MLVSVLRRTQGACADLGDTLGVGGLVYRTCLEMTFAANLPRHQYVMVDRQFCSQGKEQGWEQAVWFGLYSVPHRAWGCTVMLKCGALYRGLPLNALAFANGTLQPWTLGDAQRWDCFGWNFTTIEYDYLRELDCQVWLAGRQIWIQGAYLFTAEPYGDAYSMEPSQTKSHHFIELSNWRITCAPGNNVLFTEASFTGKNAVAKPTWLKVQTQTFHAEEQAFDGVVGEETA